MSQNKRAIDGILLLDKPTGCSSNAALQRAKRLFQASKAGHTGSLDNLASGLLPICFGEATKISGFLLNADKVYTTVCALGATTTTGDAEGEIIATRPVENFNLAQIETVVHNFIGEIQQVPPMYSALKHQGQPLYKLARKGQTIERQARTVSIYAININAMTETTLTLTVHCSKGTYIRTLVEDIGQVLGCGAHVTVLRRLQVGNYQQMFNFEQLEHILMQEGMTALDRLLMPMSTALSHLPTIHLTTTQAQAIQYGQSIVNTDLSISGIVCLFTEIEQFLGIGEIVDEGQRIIPKRLVKTNCLNQDLQN